VRRALELELIRRLIAEIDTPSAEAESTHLDVRRYLDASELEAERQRLFQQRPLIIAHEAEVPNPGDFLRVEHPSGSLLLARGPESAVRVFHNVCRHRGATLVTEERGCAKAFTCAYHAWSYRPDGALLHVPSRACFATVDDEAHRLKEVASMVRHGFVWVQLDGRPIDVPAFLGPTLEADFAALELATFSVRRTQAHLRQANWKLVMDAFAEGYHLPSLHRTSLSRFFLDDSILDDCTPHLRQVGARRDLLEARHADESTWDFSALTTLFYDVFPNTVLVFHPLWVSMLTMYPVTVDQVRVEHRMLVADSSANEAALDKSFRHIDERVFGAEDLAIAERVQSGLRSGAIETTHLGAKERGMRIWHAARDAALAE